MLKSLQQEIVSLIERHKKICYIIGYIATSLIFLTITYFVFIKPVVSIYELSMNATSLKNEISELQKQKDALSDEISNLTEQIDLMEKEVGNSQKEIINTQNTIIENIDYIATLKTKYSYLFEYRKTNPSADFGINELIYLDKVCTEKNVPVPLMLALYEHESGFNSTAKNPSSTATGYGQLINTTARSMYNRLSRGTYDISRHRVLASDKYLNIDLSVELMSYNLKSYGSITKALNAYYGHPDPNELARYSNDIENRMKKYQ